MGCISKFLDLAIAKSNDPIQMINGSVPIDLAYDLSALAAVFKQDQLEAPKRPRHPNN